jgi:hypothetical protein
MSLPTLPDLLPPQDEPRLQQAIAKLAAALGPRAGHVVVTAPTQKGAEALVWQVETEIVAYRVFWVNGRMLDAPSLLRTLGAEDPTAESLPAAVTSLLAKARSVGRPIVILVADADAASADALEELRLLAECSPDGTQFLRLVLIGKPSLMQTLRRREARALATRVTSLIAISDETFTAPLPLTTALVTEPGHIPDPQTRWPRTRRILTAGALGGIAAALVMALVPLADAPAPPLPAPGAAEPVTVEPVAAETAPAPPAAEIPAAAVEPPPAAPAVLSEPPRAREVEPEPPPPPRAIVHPSSPAAPHLQSVQVGAFRDPARAARLRETLAPRFDWVVITQIERGGALFHRVRIEGLPTVSAARTAMQTLRAAGYEPILVR